MRRTRRYNIYDVSVFDFLRSGGQFSSGIDVNVNEDLLVKEYQRGYQAAEDELNLRLDELIDKVKEGNVGTDKEADEPHKKFIESVNSKSYSKGYEESENKFKKIQQNLSTKLVELENEKHNAINESYKLGVRDMQLINKLKSEKYETFVDDGPDEPDEPVELDENAEKMKEIISQINKDSGDIKGIENMINGQVEIKEEYDKIIENLRKHEKRTQRKNDIQVVLANKKLRLFYSKNPAFEAIQKRINELRERIKTNESIIHKYRKQ